MPPPPEESFTLPATHLTPNGAALEKGKQPVLDAASSTPLSALDALPTLSSSSYAPFLANANIPEFLREDLDLSRLNRIHSHLWMCGRPMRARPLHRYKMLGTDVLPSQQLDLHLLRFSNKLILKPLPEFYLSHAFWVEYLCGDPALHAAACGFLLSYVWLLTSPVDLRLAHELYLVPSFVTWPWWKALVTDFVSHVDMYALDQVNARFHFGDLRLGRINSIYRVRHATTHFVRGYLYGYNRYVVFFQRKFSWILIVFVFFSLVLAAMQVGASVDPLDKNLAFLQSCYGFVVFSMVSVGAVLGAVGAIFVFTFLFNMVSAVGAARYWEAKRRKLAEERKEKGV